MLLKLLLLLLLPLPATNEGNRGGKSDVYNHIRWGATVLVINHGREEEEGEAGGWKQT